MRGIVKLYVSTGGDRDFLSLEPQTINECGAIIRIVRSKWFIENPELWDLIPPIVDDTFALRMYLGPLRRATTAELAEANTEHDRES